MAIDLFDTRTMLAALDQLLPAKRFLLDTFFGREEFSETQYVDIDIMKGTRRLAPFVNPVLQGKMVEREGYTTRTYRPPYIKPKMILTAEDILKRPMGSVIYSGGKSPAERAAEQLGKDLNTLQDMIVRREEWMAAQALNGGVINVVGDGVNDVIDFAMPNSHKINANWSDPDVGSPIADIRNWRRIVAQDSGLVPNVAVMGADAADAFLAHSQISGEKSLLNARRAETGQINVSDIQESGATYLGSLFGSGIDIFAYDEWYVDDNGDEQPLVPENKIFLGSTRARTARHYGAIHDLDAGQASMRWFPKIWKQDDPSAKFLMLQSAPLVVPHQIDAFAVITVTVPS